MSFTNQIDNEKGQSVVEYILLLSVVMTLVYFILTNQRFKELIGADSQYIQALRNYLEYSYRFTHPAPNNTRTQFTGYGGNHHSYYNQSKGESHFYGLVERYPAR